MSVEIKILKALHFSCGKLGRYSIRFFTYHWVFSYDLPTRRCRLMAVRLINDRVSSHTSIEMCKTGCDGSVNRSEVKWVKARDSPMSAVLHGQLACSVVYVRRVFPQGRSDTGVWWQPTGLQRPLRGYANVSRCYADRHCAMTCSLDCVS